jgi:predicted CxxxxCH...CXXCH cytochrome family protein
MAAERTLLGGAALIVAAAAASLVPGCLEQRDDAATPAARECAGCHGDPERPGTLLQRSAPPRDLFGNTESIYPGVGAHREHVLGGDTHGGVACNECHVVPSDTRDPGHADTPLPAEVSFGALASHGGRIPRYSFDSRRCSDSYCHGASVPHWTAPRSSQQACGSCHGVPPPPPHPQVEQCGGCHYPVIGPGNRFTRPELHVDAALQVAQASCSGCHGSDLNPAPPADLSGNMEVSALGVGAHQAHLAGGVASRPLACGECHIVPETYDAPGHLGPPPAEVVFSGVAAANDRAPIWDRASETCGDGWCHSPSPVESRGSPAWTSSGPLECTSCHGNPPPPPHPQSADCSSCHGAVVADDDVTIIARDRHVDGIVDAIGTGCSDCHGSADNPAPPKDLAGNVSTSAPGVGAHQAHLSPQGPARPVACAECHIVPQSVSSPGHLDGSPGAELIFSGVAVAYGAAPAYINGSCQNTYCHGASFVVGHPSGGSLTVPVWTLVDGSQVACGTCHALPPPKPHPETTAPCSDCHQNIAPSGLFVRPDLHVDGDVTFKLPP